MRVGKAKVTVILYFNQGRAEQRFKAEEYKRRSVPSYMAHLQEEIIEIKFEDGQCYRAIEDSMTNYAQVQMKCHAFFEYENGEIDVAYADVQDYYPSSLTLMGKIERASMDDIEKFRVVPAHEIERRKIERMKYKKFMEEPDLERFQHIDLED